MRPRLITAENTAARPPAVEHAQASMRPRLITAENARRASAGSMARTRFNEAAAHHRGEHALSRPFLPLTTCFNEAAAHHRGERPGQTYDLPDDDASMRPRLITAENGWRAA